MLEDLWNVEEKYLSEYYSIYYRANFKLIFWRMYPISFMGYNNKIIHISSNVPSKYNKRNKAPLISLNPNTMLCYFSMKASSFFVCVRKGLSC